MARTHRCSGPCYNGHSDGLELSDVSDIELVGNMVYDVRSTAALFMDNWSGSKIYDLVAYNNVFYTPDTGFAVYLQHAAPAPKSTTTSSGAGRRAIAIGGLGDRTRTSPTCRCTTTSF